MAFLSCMKLADSWTIRRDFHFVAPVATVFGVPLRESLRYANVPISTANGKDSLLYIYGYVPVVVAKWCILIHWICSSRIPLNCDIAVVSISKKSRQK